ncbi:MAG: MFS transporter [Thermoplasmata archaeon]
MQQEKATVIVLSVVVFLVLMGLTLITPVLPFYAQALGATIPMVGLLISGFALARVFVNIPAGVWGDRVGHRRVMSYGLLIIAVSSFLAGLAFNYWVLLAVRVAEGVGSALYVTTSMAVLVRSVPKARRGEYMSYYVAALIAGAVSGPAAGGFLAVTFGLTAPFLFYALVAFVALFLVRVFLRETIRERVQEAVGLEDVVRLLRSPSFLLVTLGALSVFLLRGGFNATLFPLWAEARFGLDPVFIGLILTLVAVAGLVTMLISGRLADRIGRKGPLMASLLLSGLILPFIFLTQTLGALSLTMVMFGLALGLHGPIAAWAADLAPEGSIGVAMGVYRSIADIGWVVGPLLLGSLGVAFGPLETNVWPFVAAAVWAIFFGLLLIPARDPVAQRRGEVPVLGNGGSQRSGGRGST